MYSWHLSINTVLLCCSSNHGTAIFSEVLLYTVRPKYLTTEGAIGSLYSYLVRLHRFLP